MKRLALAALLALAAPAAAAQTYPAKPIRLVVPFGAGSATDVVARTVGEKMGAALGQPVVVENRPGANGTIGADIVAKASPDGHTLLMTTNTPQAAAASLMKKVPYDGVADFTPVSRIANIAFVLVVGPDVKAANVAELVALGKARPGALTYASGSSGSWVPAAQFVKRAGIEATHVPYKTIPEGLTNVMGGQVTMIFADIATGLPQIKAGKVRAIAISSAKRSALLPDVPAAAETFPGFEVIAWFAIVGPAKMPPVVTERLNAEARKAVADPAVAARLSALGMEPQSSTPAELGAFIASEREKWARMVKDAGIQPE